MPTQQRPNRALTESSADQFDLIRQLNFQKLVLASQFLFARYFLLAISQGLAFIFNIVVISTSQFKEKILNDSIYIYIYVLVYNQKLKINISTSITKLSTNFQNLIFNVYNNKQSQILYYSIPLQQFMDTTITSQYQNGQDIQNNSQWLNILINSLRNQISNDVLILSDVEVTNIEFIQNFEIKVLEINLCKSVILNLYNDTIKELVIKFSNVTCLSGLKLPNLEILALEDVNQQLDITNVTNFKNLMCVTLSGYKNVDISPLQTLNQLKSVNLVNSGINNLTSLANIIKLTDLSLSYDRVKDINPTNYFKQLEALQQKTLKIWSSALKSKIVSLKEQVMNQILYDQRMTEQLQNRIVNNFLMIINMKELNSIEFLQNLNVLKLEFKYCQNLIPKLESKLIQQLTLKECKINNLELLTLENLEALCIEDRPYDNFKQHIKHNLNLNCVHKFTKLTEIKLSGYNNLDIIQLQNVEKLLKLQLTECENIRLRLVSHSIQQLIIKNCKIQSIEELLIFNIQYLYLEDNSSYYNKLTSITNIENYSSLKQLYIIDYEALDATPIQYCTQLQELELYSCNTQNIDFLRTLIHLQDFRIIDRPKNFETIQISKLNQWVMSIEHYNKIQSLDFLQNLQIQQLTLNQCQMPTLQPRNKYIQQLKVKNCNLRNINLIQFNLENLELLTIEDQYQQQFYLNLSNYRVQKLKEINIIGRNITNITFKHFLNLTTINLIKCNIVSLNEFSSLNNVIELNLSRNSIVFVKPIQNLVKLMILNVQENSIVDLNVLQTHPNFKKYKVQNQNHPTINELLIANKIIKMQMVITLQHKILYMKTEFNNRIKDKQHKMRNCVETEKHNMILFTGTIISLFQQLNHIETYL
ncbi:Conserved_hypothetical protein [Hexamita inflata]|uniref:Transmembrane protein n=1 Tax=Hexamita inflata TaxID=28002 RepID=A0ABP1HFJ9_9EUKA